MPDFTGPKSGEVFKADARFGLGSVSNTATITTPHGDVLFPDSKFPPPDSDGLPVFPSISRLQPIAVTPGSDFGGGLAAANAVDADYGSYWRSVNSPNGGTAQWIAVDIRSKSAAEKANVWFLFKNGTAPTYQPVGALGSDAASPYISMPRNYLIQGHTSTSAVCPVAGDVGWTTLPGGSVTDNRWAHRIHTGLNLSTYGWFRFYVTAANGATGANDDVNVQIDLRNAAAGGKDSFVWFGDSISMEATRGRNVDNSLWAAGSGPLENMIETLTGRIPPVVLDASTAGWRADLAEPVKATYLAPFTGCGYLVLPYGANDANAAGVALSGTSDAYAITYKNNMQSIITYAISLGMKVMLPSILYGSSSAWSAGNRVILNQILTALVAANGANVIAGPDLYTYFAAHTNLLRDALHPTWDESDPAGKVGGLTGYGHWHDMYVTRLSALY